MKDNSNSKNNDLNNSNDNEDNVDEEENKEKKEYSNLVTKNKLKESQKLKAEKYKSDNIIEEMVGEEEDPSLLIKTNNIENLDNKTEGKFSINENDENSSINNTNRKVFLNNDDDKEKEQLMKEFENNLERRKFLNTISNLNTTGTKFEAFLIKNLIPNAFNKIMSELIVKNVKKEDYFAYTAARLNEIGKEYEDLKLNYSFKDIN